MNIAQACPVVQRIRDHWGIVALALGWIADHVIMWIRFRKLLQEFQNSKADGVRINKEIERLDNVLEVQKREAETRRITELLPLYANELERARIAQKQDRLHAFDLNLFAEEKLRDLADVPQEIMPKLIDFMVEQKRLEPQAMNQGGMGYRFKRVAGD